MGKAARNRAIMRVAVQATIGKPEHVTRAVARSMRHAERDRRRARRYKLLERLAYTARTKPLEHYPAVQRQPASKTLFKRARGWSHR